MTRVKHAALLIAVLGAGCSTATPPPAPPATPAQQRDATAAVSSTDSSTTTGSGTATGSASGTDTSTQTVPATANFTPGGAAIGSTTDQAAVTACLTAKTFYDRFGNSGTGQCTTDALAPVNCNDAGIQGILTASQKTAYEAQVTGSGPFVGWLIDQCLDCPPGNTLSYCTKGNGFVEVGTKVFFVQEVNNELSQQSLCLPVRPGQANVPADSCGTDSTGTSSGSATSSSTSSGTGTGTGS